ncbi:MAG TPA: protein kinase, partial [Myxococcota bacterium]
MSSPHVVAVHAVGEDSAAGPFVVMEYLRGEDLHARLGRDGKLPWREAVQVARDAALGLRAAEGAGIVHRDIKPANLFIVDGKAKLTDFGLAREIEGASVTQAGLVVGTPAYLAPEVIKGAAATSKSDLYSLGATLFHLISGRPPFTAASPLEVVADAVRVEPPPLASVADVPVALSELVGRMLKKDPEQRPRSFEALDTELGHILEHNAPAPRTMQLGSLPQAPSQPSFAPIDFRAGDFSGPQPVTMAAAAPSSPSLASLAGMPVTAPTQSAPPVTLPPAEVSSPSAVSSGAVPRLKTAALTVMMTDIAGYSERTSRVSREEGARWLALHDQLLTPVFRAFQGRVVKTLGDAFLVTFPSPTDAVHCACAIQDRLFLHNSGSRPEDAIEVRVALSTGEVRLHKGDVFGEPVNLAARLQALGAPGEVLVSDATYATMNAAEVRLVPRGEHMLKGIPRSVKVYAAVPDGVAGQPPFGGRALAHVSAPFFSRRRILVAAALGAVLIAALLAFVLHDNRLARIDRGEARAVMDEILKKPEASLDGKDLAMVGHALVALGDKGRAFTYYRSAGARKYVDDRMRGALFLALDKKDDDGAEAVLAA